MAGEARRSRSYLLVTLFLLSLASFGASSTQAAESNVCLEPWSYVDSSTDISTTRITTAGEDLVISTFVENDKSSTFEINITNRIRLSNQNMQEELRISFLSNEYLMTLKHSII